MLLQPLKRMQFLASAGFSISLVSCVELWRSKASQQDGIPLRLLLMGLFSAAGGFAAGFAGRAFYKNGGSSVGSQLTTLVLTFTK
jgi:hypothetical protein